MNTAAYNQDFDSYESENEFGRPAQPQRSNRPKQKSTQRMQRRASGFNGIHRRRNKRWTW